MKNKFPKKSFILFLKIGFAFLLLWCIIEILSNPGTFLQKAVNHFWLISYLIIFNFILFEYTIPFIRLTWKRILLTPLLLFAHLMFYSFGLFAWRYIGIQLSIYTEILAHDTVIEGVEYYVPYSFFSIIFFGVVKYTYEYNQLKKAAQQLRIEKQEAELNYLKSQTNPHFLFNTLNNIYSLARDKSDLAPESILRLSKILRFMLYETSGQFIAIEQELKIMNDYIILEKLRYDDSLILNFNYDVEDMKQSVPPLLLIPLVQNAFKHGVSETRNNPYINIHLSVKNRQLVFVVKNSFDHQPSKNKIKENIGLANLRRQLELLYTDSNLSLQQENAVFTTTLKINLASYV